MGSSEKAVAPAGLTVNGRKLASGTIDCAALSGAWFVFKRPVPRPCILRCRSLRLSILLATRLYTPTQIGRMQSRPLAFGRMWRKAALTAKRLICKNTLAGCDGLIPYTIRVTFQVLLEDTIWPSNRVLFLQKSEKCKNRTRNRPHNVSFGSTAPQTSLKTQGFRTQYKFFSSHCNISRHITVQIVWKQ